MSQPPISRQDLIEEARRLLASLDEGTMSETAYDTAWVARIPNPDVPSEPLYPAAYDWLLNNQRTDGSWGAEIPFAHDRVVSTVAALVTLARSSYRKGESEQAVRRAVVYLNRERPNLREDEVDTVGFELILPELVQEARSLGLNLPYSDWEFVEDVRDDKLRRIPPIAIYGGPTTLTTSVEYLGANTIPTLLSRCQSPNGSYGSSPSATSYAVLRRPDPAAEAYIRRVVALSPNGGILFLYPFEVFETAWVLYYLGEMRLSPEVLRPYLERLQAGWGPSGASWSRTSPVPDVDDSAVVITVLRDTAYRLDPDIVVQYEAADYFYTFPLERNPSVTSNAHVLEMLRNFPSTADRRRMILKITHFLRNERVDDRFWMDKWHASPYYATAHTIRSLSGMSTDMVRTAVAWLVETQLESGAWGFGEGTLEETALAMTGLMSAVSGDRAIRDLVRPALDRGASYLTYGLDTSPYPALWSGKALYTAPHIVRACILGALHQWANAFAPEAS